VSGSAIAGPLFLFCGGVAFLLGGFAEIRVFGVVLLW
jgi:hypothetical protein